MTSNIRKIAEQRVDKKIKFLRNLKAYIIVNTILIIVNAIFTPEFWWVIFPLFFWGIGVLADGIRAYDRFDNEEYRERKIKEEMDKLSD